MNRRLAQAVRAERRPGDKNVVESGSLRTALHQGVHRQASSVGVLVSRGEQRSEEDTEDIVAADQLEQFHLGVGEFVIDLVRDLELATVHSAERVAIVDVRLHAPEIALQQAVARRVAGPGSQDCELDRFIGHPGDACDRHEFAEFRTVRGRRLAAHARLGGPLASVVSAATESVARGTPESTAAGSGDGRRCGRPRVCCRTVVAAVRTCGECQPGRCHETQDSHVSRALYGHRIPPGCAREDVRRSDVRFAFPTGMLHQICNMCSNFGADCELGNVLCSGRDRQRSRQARNACPTCCSDQAQKASTSTGSMACAAGSASWQSAM